MGRGPDPLCPSSSDDDEYVDLQLGDWNDDDDNTIRAAFAEAFELSDETTSNVTWAYPTRINRKYSTSDEDPIPELPIPTDDNAPALIDPTNSTSSNKQDKSYEGADLQCEPCTNTLFDDYFKEYDAAFSGMKESLDSRHRKMDSLKLHIDSGCMGHHPDCPICKSLKRSVRRRYQLKDPHRETRVGYCWGFDLITNKTESLFGNKYTFQMRDYKTGYFKLKHIRTKDQVTAAARECIEELRSDPRFTLPADCNYQLVSELRCDCAGEQRDDNEEWRAMCKEMGVHCV